MFALCRLTTLKAEGAPRSVVATAPDWLTMYAC
jgi:hypothetical protein